MTLVRLRYRSRRALDADHAAYLSHGGMLLPVDGVEAPPVNSRIHLEILAPNLSLVLTARAGATVPGQGCLISFEAEASDARADLDRHVADPDFVAARDLEPEAVILPEIEFISAELPAPDPLPLHALETVGSDEEATDPALPAPALDAVPSASGDPDLEHLDLSLDDDGRSSLDADTDVATAMSPTDGEDRPQDPAREKIEGEEATEAEPAKTVEGEGPRGQSPAAYDVRRPLPGPGQTVLRVPRAGERYPVVAVRYLTLLSFMDDAEGLEATAALTLSEEEWGAHPRPERNQVLRVKLVLPGHNIFEMWAVIEDTEPDLVVRADADDAQLRKACLHPTSHQARNRREREEASEEARPPRHVIVTFEEKPEESEKMPLRRRLQRMGMEDKINLALSGNREERMALAQDSNKSIHHYLLKNAKLTIDEVAFMARLPSLNPDVLDKIAENPGYTQNPAVTKSLVFNPRTPLRTAMRLLDRMPRSELGVLARRTGMNKRLVMAAKNKLTGSKW